MYQYTDFDRQFVRQRAAQYRDQLERNLRGELKDDEFRPLRLQNGWYVQRYAPMLPLPRIVAADIAYAVPLPLVAGTGHASLGSVDWSMLSLLLAGSLPGIWLGSHFMTRVPERAIRSLLSVLLAYAGTKLIAL